jgi:hypothetical protein
MCCSYGHADADVRPKMDVRHYSDVLNVCRTAKTFDCFSHVTLQWFDEPRM